MYLAEVFSFLWKLVLHPYKATKTKAGIGESLKFYMTVMFFYSLISSAVVSFLPQSPYLYTGIEALKVYFSPVIIFFLYFLMTFLFSVIGLFISSGIIHGIARLFRIIRGDFSKTFAAFAFSNSVISTLYLPLQIMQPAVSNFMLVILYGILALAIFVWCFVIFTIAMSNQHKVSRLRGFLSFFVPFTFIMVIFLILFVVVLLLLLPTGSAS